MSKENKNYLLAAIMALIAVCGIVYTAGAQEKFQNDGVKDNKLRALRLERKLDKHVSESDHKLNLIIEMLGRR